MEVQHIPGPSDNEPEIVTECNRLINRPDFVVAVWALPQNLQAQVDLGECTYVHLSVCRGSSAGGRFQGQRLILLVRRCLRRLRQLQGPSLSAIPLAGNAP